MSSKHCKKATFILGRKTCVDCHKGVAHPYPKK
ncbi:NapC/NirT family cytochrome c [uncultured Shewanella sp.]